MSESLVPNAPETICKERAFTLLEVLVALAILSIAGISIFQLFSANTRAIAMSGDYINAHVEASAKLQEIIDRDDTAEGSWSEVTREGHRMDVTIAEALRERTDGLPVNLFEIDLTIHWSKDGREKLLTLRTLKLVDNNTVQKAARP